MLEIGQIRQHIQALNAVDPTTRREALHSLKVQEEKEWVDVPTDVVRPLVESLRHQLQNGVKQAFLRQELLIVLGKIGPRSEPAIPQLVELLHEGVPDGIREEAATALGKIGKKSMIAVDQMVKTLGNCRPTLAVRVILALSDIGAADPKVRSALVSLWTAPDQNQHSQVQVALALCKLKIHVQGLLPFLSRTLVSNPDANLRKAALEGLSYCGKNDIDAIPAVPTLALNDKDERIRVLAETALTNMKVTREAAVRICAKQLKESTYGEIALKKSGAIAIPALIEALGNEVPTPFREKASRILGGFGEEAAAAAPKLAETLEDESIDVRLAGAKALWNVTKVPDLVVPVLVELLNEKKEGAKDPKDAEEMRRQFLQTVIEALWRIGPPAKAAVPALNKKVKDKNRLVSESATNAIKEISPPVPVPKAATR